MGPNREALAEWEGIVGHAVLSTDRAVYVLVEGGWRALRARPRKRGSCLSNQGAQSRLSPEQRVSSEVSPSKCARWQATRWPWNPRALYSISTPSIETLKSSDLGARA